MRSRLLRIVLGVVGLALAVYGAACWRGGWLGVPPYHGIVRGPNGEEIYPPGGLGEELMRLLGGQFLMVFGLVVLAFAAWPRSLGLRIAVGVGGLLVVGYMVASLTGGWFGTPPWWEQWIPITPEATPVETRGNRLFVQARVDYESVPTRGRELVSAGVIALGLAIVAFASWPRRTTPQPPVA